MLFESLIHFWRNRLAWIDQHLAAAPHDGFRLRAERRVISFFLNRHVDGKFAFKPSEAVALDPESAKKSNQVWIRENERVYFKRIYFKKAGAIYANVRDVR